jgi:hypothetical protein
MSNVRGLRRGDSRVLSHTSYILKQPCCLSVCVFVTDICGLRPGQLLRGAGRGVTWGSGKLTVCLPIVHIYKRIGGLRRPCRSCARCPGRFGLPIVPCAPPSGSGHPPLARWAHRSGWLEWRSHGLPTTRFENVSPTPRHGKNGELKSAPQFWN